MISDAALMAMLRALDVCVIEGSPSVPPVLRLLTEAPDWLAGVFADVPAEAGQTVGGATPFLDHFLQQAEEVWHHGPPASAASGPFVVPGVGEDVLLRAVAVTQDGRRFLILQHLAGDADLRPALQRAREQILEQERLVRQVGALHAPAAAMDRDIKALLAAALSPEQRQLAERLSQLSAELQGVVATLPAPSSRHRRQARTQ